MFYISLVRYSLSMKPDCPRLIIKLKYCKCILLFYPNPFSHKIPALFILTLNLLRMSVVVREYPTTVGESQFYKIHRKYLKYAAIRIKVNSCSNAYVFGLKHSGIKINRNIIILPLQFIPLSEA